ncbi:hypothetical protein PSSHI_22150 [Photobacterium sp. R1]
MCFFHVYFLDSLLVHSLIGLAKTKFLPARVSLNQTKPDKRTDLFVQERIGGLKRVETGSSQYPDA